MTNRYFLFDIDGVLVKPGGYRKASIDAAKHFLEEFGINCEQIDEEYFNLFESIGITSEWDMVPLLLLTYIEHYLVETNLDRVISTKEALRAYLQRSNTLSGPAYEKITGLKRYLTTNNDAPCDLILAKIRKQDTVYEFMTIQHYCPLLIEEVLTGTRDPHISKITAYFQNLMLGSEIYQEIIKREPLIKTGSYLITYDSNNLSYELAVALRDAYKKKSIYCAGITARPSVPDSIQQNEHLYFPEAELGIKTAGIDWMPVVGFGEMVLLSEKTAQSGELYLKPSPLHALASILASIGFAKSKAVEVAHRVFSNGKISEDDTTLLNILFGSRAQITVFEDSIGGIISVKALGEFLRKLGYQIETNLCGISDNEHKITALKKENAAIYVDLNAALSELL